MTMKKDIADENATLLKEAKDRKKANRQQYIEALERKEQKQQKLERHAAEAAEEERIILEYLENSHQNAWYSKSVERIKELLNDSGYKVSIKYAKELKRKKLTLEENKKAMTDKDIEKKKTADLLQETL